MGQKTFCLVCKYVNELLRWFSYNINKLPLTETEMFGPVKGFVLG